MYTHVCLGKFVEGDDKIKEPSRFGCLVCGKTNDVFSSLAKKCRRAACVPGKASELGEVCLTSGDGLKPGCSLSFSSLPRGVCQAIYTAPVANVPPFRPSHFPPLMSPNPFKKAAMPPESHFFFVVLTTTGK